MAYLTDVSLKHFKLEADNNKIAWLSFDHADKNVNVLTTQALDELDYVLDLFAKQPPAGMVLLSGKSSGFIAGANINDFSNVTNTDATMALVARGWKLFQRFANVSYPTLALIQGHCLGGGLELALACRYRLAVSSPNTRFALPEVRLGIFPGWGGMKRLPRLIGPIAALNLMLTGRSADTQRAKQLGLVDAVVPERIARQAAAQMVLSNKPRRQANTWLGLLNHKFLRPVVARQVRKQIEKQNPYQHYKAPNVILNIWLHHEGNPLKAPDQIEELTQSNATKNLIRVYHLQEQLKSLVTGKAKTNQHIHVIGAGIMGGGIAAWFALHGFKVTLQDQNLKAIAAAQGNAFKLFKRRLKRPHLIQAAMDRLIPDQNGYGIPHANLVIEAIIEKSDAKQALYQIIEPQLQAGAILATNTSSLSVTELSKVLRHPQNFVGLHFFNPVAQMPLVELIKTAATSAETASQALKFIGAIAKLPLPVTDSPGFLVNAALAPYLLEAMRSHDNGLSAATIDRAMLEFGMPMGPMELADTVGLDTIGNAAAQLGNDQAIPACLTRLLNNNQLGKKTGQGFYTWVNGKAQKNAAATPPSGLAESLIRPLIHKTAECVNNKVIANADLADAGLIFGTGFAPFLGGPLNYGRQVLLMDEVANITNHKEQ